jgi:hypothetical protein
VERETAGRTGYMKVGTLELGQKAKGFRFTNKKNSSNMYWDQRMEKYVGREGSIVEIVYESRMNENYITIQFEILTEDHRLEEVQPRKWCYPIKEYLREMREQRLNELGI